MSELLWNSVMMWTFHNTVLISSICLGSELVFLLLHLAALLHNYSAASMNTTPFVLFSTWPFETHREIPVYLQQTESEFTGETIYPRIWPSPARGTERERVRVLSCLCAEGKGYSSQALKSLRGLYMSVLVRRGSFFYLSFFPYSSCRPAFLFSLSLSLSIFPLPLSPAPVDLQVLMALWNSIKAAGALSHFSLRTLTLFVFLLQLSLCSPPHSQLHLNAKIQRENGRGHFIVRGRAFACILVSIS